MATMADVTNGVAATISHCGSEVGQIANATTAVTAKGMLRPTMNMRINGSTELSPRSTVDIRNIIWSQDGCCP